MDSNTPSPEVLKKYLIGNCNQQERDLVDAWYRSINFNADGRFSSADEELLYERIQSRISGAEIPEEKSVSVFARFGIYRTAAVVILMLGFLYFYSVQPVLTVSQKAAVKAAATTFRNSQKKIIRYQLPDQSIVWLQPGATIVHPLSFGQKNREIRFQGEGFFDVTRDAKHPFVIHCGKLKTRVLGTTFNVKANANESVYKVSVVTGSVAVSTPGVENKTETVILKPKQQAVFEKMTNSMRVDVVKNSDANNENWQAVSLVFNETPMTEVASRLQKTFRIKIEFANPEIRKCRLKVDFNNQRLPEILEMLGTLLGTTYEIEGDKVTLKGEGCKNG